MSNDRRFQVIRPYVPGKVKMSRGIGHDKQEWEEDRFLAIVRDTLRGETIGRACNSSLLCLSGGRSVRAPEATDEQIIEAIVGDERI